MISLFEMIIILLELGIPLSHYLGIRELAQLEQTSQELQSRITNRLWWETLQLEFGFTAMHLYPGSISLQRIEQKQAYTVSYMWRDIDKGVTKDPYSSDTCATHINQETPYGVLEESTIPRINHSRLCRFLLRNPNRPRLPPIVLPKQCGT